jgi:hypothetical protein
MSPVELRFQAIASLLSELRVTQYCVPAASDGFAIEFRIRGALLAPNKPKEAPGTMKLSSGAVGWSPLFRVRDTVKLSGQPDAYTQLRAISIELTVALLEALKLSPSA